jgi:hypothetical protein
MLARYKTLILGALLGAGTMAFSGASLAGTVPFALLTSDTNAGDVGVIQVVERDRGHREWNRKRHGNRCREAFGNCRHFHGGYYYETPWWTLPLIIDGGSRYDDDDYDDLGDSHVEWCLDRYRSYNPRTNTWVSYSGEVRECRSPYA